MLRKIVDVLVMIKIEHTVFALPFAVIGMLTAASPGFPGWDKVTWILLAMVSARSAAMAFNRIVDRRFDAANPRTRERPIPAGKISSGFAAIFTVVMAGLFFLSAGMLNNLCLKLSPIALGVIFGYSYTKRFTALSHFVLGAGLAMAPVGAWLAVKPEFHPLPLLFGAAVLLWVAGFDIIYACLDVEFDRRTGLKSIPARIGAGAGLVIAALCHAGTVICLVAVAAVAPVGPVYLVGCGFITILLLYEHTIVRPDDPGGVNRAFFGVNAVVSVTVMATVVGDWMLRNAG